VIGSAFFARKKKLLPSTSSIASPPSTSSLENFRSLAPLLARSEKLHRGEAACVHPLGKTYYFA
jgi:hypothetical protein